MKSLLTLFVTLTAVFSIAGQATNTIILLNGTATKVSLGRDGTVLENKGEAAGYMAGYEAYNPSMDKRILRPTTVPTNIQTTTTTYNSAVEQSQFATALNDIKFEVGTATLTTSAIATLDKIVSNSADYPNGIQLETSFVAADVSAKTIATNRINACKNYLSTKGFPASKILISIGEASQSTSIVSLLVR